MEKENEIPQMYLYKIDTSTFKNTLYFKAIFLKKNRKNGNLTPIYQKISKVEYDEFDDKKFKESVITVDE